MRARKAESTNQIQTKASNDLEMFRCSLPWFFSQVMRAETANAKMSTNAGAKKIDTRRPL